MTEKMKLKQIEKQNILGCLQIFKKKKIDKDIQTTKFAFDEHQ